jgi:hypothetical protein
MKLKLIMLVSLFAFGLAFNANAGAVADADSDLVPDGFDNCSARANGPNDPSNQVDADQDGYGNACDSDYNDDGSTTTLDFPTFLDAFTGAVPDAQTDHNGDGATTTLDFTRFLNDFTGLASPGPSGLGCAGHSPNPAPCLP